MGGPEMAPKPPNNVRSAPAQSRVVLKPPSIRRQALTKPPARAKAMGGPRARVIDGMLRNDAADWAWTDRTHPPDAEGSVLPVRSSRSSVHGVVLLSTEVAGYVNRSWARGP